MRIQVPIKHYEDVTLSPEQVRDIAIYAIRQAFEIPRDAFIVGNELKRDVEYHTSHSWITEKKIRDVRPGDEAAVLVIKHLLEMK